MTKTRLEASIFAHNLVRRMKHATWNLAAWTQDDDKKKLERNSASHTRALLRYIARLEARAADSGEGEANE